MTFESLVWNVLDRWRDGNGWHAVTVSEIKPELGASLTGSIHSFDISSIFTIVELVIIRLGLLNSIRWFDWRIWIIWVWFRHVNALKTKWILTIEICFRYDRISLWYWMISRSRKISLIPNLGSLMNSIVCTVRTDTVTNKLNKFFLNVVFVGVGKIYFVTIIK